MTPPLVERIIAAHAGVDTVESGSLHFVDVDRVYLQDGNTPTIAKMFEEYGFERVFDASKIDVFFDHSVLISDRLMANKTRDAQDFARRFELNVFHRGEGISHIVQAENEVFSPGSLVVGSDSHTCLGGAF